MGPLQRHIIKSLRKARHYQTTRQFTKSYYGQWTRAGASAMDRACRELVDAEVLVRGKRDWALKPTPAFKRTKEKKPHPADRKWKQTCFPFVESPPTQPAAEPLPSAADTSATKAID
jgi:hypothetical protein